MIASPVASLAYHRPPVRLEISSRVSRLPRSEIRGVSYRYPAELGAFLRRNREAGQVQAQSHLNRLGAEDYLALHQRADGEHVFPLQVVALLSDPAKDFQGG